MSLDPRSPVLVGGGQWSNRVDEGAEPVEPVDLLAEAARRAAADTGAADPSKVLASLDSVRVVSLLSWRYLDPGRLVAERVGAAEVRSTWYSNPGGNTPQALLNRTCLDIAAGEADVVLLGGAEAWRTRMAARGVGERPAWTVQPDTTEPSVVFGGDFKMDQMVHPDEAAPRRGDARAGVPRVRVGAAGGGGGDARGVGGASRPAVVALLQRWPRPTRTRGSARRSGPTRSCSRAPTTA